MQGGLPSNHRRVYDLLSPRRFQKSWRRAAASRSQVMTQHDGCIANLGLISD